MSAAKEAALGERDCVVWFLRDVAAGHRKHASALLADSQQSKPQADHYDDLARSIDDLALTIKEGRHWR